MSEDIVVRSTTGDFALDGIPHGITAETMDMVEVVGYPLNVVMKKVSDIITTLEGMDSVSITSFTVHSDVDSYVAMIHFSRPKETGEQTISETMMGRFVDELIKTRQQIADIKTQVNRDRSKHFKEKEPYKGPYGGTSTWPYVSWNVTGKSDGWGPQSHK